MSLVVLKQTKFYSFLKLKESLRISKLKIFISLFFLICVSLEYGFGIAMVYSTGLTKFFASSSNFDVPIDLTGYLFRDLLVNGILACYLSILALSLLKSIFGVNNPFITSRFDINFQHLIPINPYVSFLTKKINNGIRNLLLITLCAFLIFGPLITILHISYLRLLPIAFNFFLGFELIEVLSDCMFFLTKPIRSILDLGILFAEKNNLISNASLIVIPFIFIEFGYRNQLFTFQFVQNLAFIPFLNLSVANTSLLFRSGISFSAYIGMVSLSIQVVFLILLALLFIKFISTTSEFGELLPIIEFLNAKQINFIVNDEYYITPSLSKVDENEEFLQTSTYFSLIKKEILLIKRNSDLIFNFLFIIILSAVTISLYILGLNVKSDLFVLALFTAVYLLFFVLDLLTKIIYSISLNKKILNSSNSQIIQIKSFFILLVSIPFLVLFAIKLNFMIIIIFGLTVLISELLTKYNVRNFFITMYIGFFLGFLFLAFAF